MGWKESDRVSERGDFVRLASLGGCSFSELCRRFGISRKTGYKWRKRYLAEGDSGLHDRSRRPSRSPGRTPSELEQAIVELRDEHPAWGGRKLRAVLLKRGYDSPSASTITAILRRHGRVNPADSRKHQRWKRFERPEPNELWQMDFKGEFKVCSDWCYPLTIIDDHSRYSLALEACVNQRRETVIDRLRRVFSTYGIPRAIYVDNGNPWGTPHRGFPHTRTSVWLLRHDIQVIHGKPHHPQGRGKLERFHRTLDQEVLQGRNFATFSDVQSAFDPWRTIYNHERPHQALKMTVPAQRYSPSRLGLPAPFRNAQNQSARSDIVSPEHLSCERSLRRSTNRTLRDNPGRHMGRVLPPLQHWTNQSPQPTH